MEENITNTVPFGIGAYILNTDSRMYTSFQQAGNIFLTQENHRGIKKEMLRLINESSEVLKICSYIITDEEIFDAILNKAESNNTAIFILTQLDRKKLTNQFSLIPFLTEDEIKENSTQTHINKIQKLYDNGVHVRAAESAHAKFIIADRQKGFITSANLTTPSLTLNTETGVYLNKKSCEELDKLFDIIFQAGTEYRHFTHSPKKNKILVSQSLKEVNKQLLPDPSMSDLRYTYETDTNNLYDEIISIINAASDYLYISTFSIVELSSLNEFTQAIKDAHGRGVKISIFCRGMNFRHDHLEGSQILHSIGCNLFADVSNHSKGVVTEKSGIIFTANLDGKHGLKNGFEVGYLLDEKQRLDFLSVHRYLIRQACYTFQNKPSRQTFFHTYAHYEMAKGIPAPVFPTDITIIAKSGLIETEPALLNLPIFYGRSKEEEYLIFGYSCFTCKIKDNTITLLKKETGRLDLERYILKYANLKIISG
jgi:hypothetical protein